MEYVVVAVILLVVLVAGAVGLVVPKLRRRQEPPTVGGAGTTTLEPPSDRPTTTLDRTEGTFPGQRDAALQGAVRAVRRNGHAAMLAAGRYPATPTPCRRRSEVPTSPRRRL
jgi:hypothetical protein